MKTKLLLLITFLSTLLVNAQSPDFNWVRTMGSAGSDVTRKISVDPWGNVFSTGNFSGTTDFDPGSGSFTLSCNGVTDFFIQKLDKNGNFLWAHGYGSALSDEAWAVASDNQGNVYLTGYFQDSIDFDPGTGIEMLYSTGLSDAFILKLDSGGNFVWVTQLGGQYSQSGKDIAVDGNGNSYITGRFAGLSDFNLAGNPVNLTTSSSTDHDIFILKLNPNGSFGWIKQMGSTGNQFSQAISLDEQGNILTTGYFYGTVDFDPGPSATIFSAVSDYDIWIQKLDKNGNFKWAKHIAGSWGEMSWDIVSDPFGSVYVSGYYYMNTDFDPGPGTYVLSGTDKTQGFLLKLDSLGLFQWAHKLGGPESDAIYAIDTDIEGNVYATGTFQATADFDPGTAVLTYTSNGSGDLYIQKLDSAGVLDWAVVMGGSSNEQAFDIQVTGNGAIHLGGYFMGVPDFDPSNGSATAVSQGSYDCFSMKMYTCSATFSTINENACGIYTSPSGNNTWTSSGTYTDVISNTNGCDSIITINLTINMADTSVTVSGGTLIANAGGATYQWLDCNNNMAPVPGENGQSFTPVVSGSYAVEITQNTCTDTSSCYSVVATAIKNEIQADINVWPNPSNGHFNISLNSDQGKAEILIYDLEGRCVYFNRADSGSDIRIESDFSQRLYLLKVVTEKGTFSKKLLFN